MDILQIAVAILIAELVMWELPQYLSKRVRRGLGVLICLSVSAVVSIGVFYILTISQPEADKNKPVIIAMAMFLLFGVGSNAALWYELRKLD